jgi:hypothetical protein
MRQFGPPRYVDGVINRRICIVIEQWRLGRPSLPVHRT